MIEYGWNEYFATNFQKCQGEGLSPGRVFIAHKHLYRLYTEFGEVLGEVSGRFRHLAESTGEFPAVGDWVAAAIRPEEKRATIHGILPRKSRFSRKLAGEETREQVVAANIDTVFIVSSLNQDFNLRRIERYLVMAWESGANPVILLSKADLCQDAAGKLREVEKIAPGVTILMISALTGTGLDGLTAYLTGGKTSALIGSSGVGKSTLINRLMGKDLLKVREIREDDDHGRHTTTHRELVLLPAGGLMIDTPGMRELQLWEGGGGFQETFTEIEELAETCRFKDCRHDTEPGCAVKAALETGIIAPDRMESYRKLQKELRYLERKQDQLGMEEQKRYLKSIAKEIKRLPVKKR